MYEVFSVFYVIYVARFNQTDGRPSFGSKTFYFSDILSRLINKRSHY